MAVCPHCEQPIPEFAGVVLDDLMGVLAVGDDRIRLTPTETRIFRLLLDARGRTVRKTSIWEDLYWRHSSGEERDLKTVDVLVFKLRRKLEPLAVTIATDWGRGYHLEA